MAEVDDFLAHYGVTGMKWGKRSGGLKERAMGAAKDSVQRRLTTNKEIAAGRGQTRDFRRVALKRYGGLTTMGFVPSPGSKKAAAKRAGTLEDRMKRLESGKLKKRDIADALINTHPADLLVSRVDKRGLPGGAVNKVNSGRQHVAKTMLGVGTAVAIGALNTPQAKQAAKNVAGAVLNAAVVAKKASNAAKAQEAHRVANNANTRGLPSNPIYRATKNPTTGHWV